MMDLLLTNMQLSLHEMSTDELSWTQWLLWRFFQLFGLWFWRHPFTGETVMECYISPNRFPWRNNLIYISGGLRARTFSAKFHFWLNHSFNDLILVWNTTLTDSVRFTPKSQLYSCAITKRKTCCPYLINKLFVTRNHGAQNLSLI